MHIKDHIASVELYGIIGVTSTILEKALSGILDVLCWVCLQRRYEIDGGEDDGVDSRMPWMRVFSLALRTGVLSEVGFWTSDPCAGETYNAGESAPCVKLGANLVSTLEI